jgi:hypothetical protein
MATPTYLLPVCSKLIETKAGTFIPMKCHWTAQAELAAGAAVVLIGLAMLFVKSSEGMRLSGLMLAAMGVLSALFATTLIGMCKDPSMACRVGTLPALMILSTLTFVVGAVGFLFASRAEARALQPA